VLLGWEWDVVSDVAHLDVGWVHRKTHVRMFVVVAVGGVGWGWEGCV